MQTAPDDTPGVFLKKVDAVCRAFPELYTKQAAKGNQIELTILVNELYDIITPKVSQ